MKAREFWVFLPEMSASTEQLGHPDDYPRDDMVHVIEIRRVHELENQIKIIREQCACAYSKEYEKLEYRITKLRKSFEDIRWSWENDAGRQCDNIAYEALAADDKESGSK